MLTFGQVAPPQAGFQSRQARAGNGATYRPANQRERDRGALPGQQPTDFGPSPDLEYEVFFQEPEAELPDSSAMYEDESGPADDFSIFPDSDHGITDVSRNGAPSEQQDGIWPKYGPWIIGGGVLALGTIIVIAATRKKD